MGPIPGDGPRIKAISLPPSLSFTGGWPGEEQGTEPRTSGDHLWSVASSTKQSRDRDSSIQKSHPAESQMRLGTHWNPSLEETATKELENKFTYSGTELNSRKNERYLPKIMCRSVVNRSWKHKVNTVEMTTGGSEILHIVPQLQFHSVNLCGYTKDLVAWQ